MCAGWTAVKPDSPTARRIGEAAIAKLNEDLRKYPGCQQLVFMNCTSVLSGQGNEYQLELAVENGRNGPTHFTIDLRYNMNSKTPTAEIHKVYQQETYSVYDSCRPRGAPLHTCIC